MIELWGVELPERHELPALPRGVVLHWTGGGSRANSVDLDAYHYVVEFDGTVRHGRWSVAANMRQVSGSAYAAHVGGWNSYRVGLSAAGMKGYSGLHNTGPHPLTATQVHRLLEVAEYFLELGGLDPLDPAHLCSHREVWTLHGIKGKQNHQKRDIEFLPFLPQLKPADVGYYLRDRAEDVRHPLPPISDSTIEQRLADASPLPPALVLPPLPATSHPPHLDLEAPWWRRLVRRLAP